ncbi:MAG: flavin reductase family protein [Actinobacteria bacterium]|nr:flavin reductase family protein [Actinomycetota bacterium]
MNGNHQKQRFKDAIGNFATGVTVVTAFTEDGLPTGMTANAITSLSLDPLLMIVCFDKTARTRVAAVHSGRVGVNVLAAGQEAISKSFASKASEEEKFAGVGWSERAGVPVLDGCVAWFAGELSELLPGGDHEIGVVAVSEFGADGGEPLLYWNGAYGRVLGESNRSELTGSVEFMATDDELVEPIENDWLPGGE